MGSRTQPGRRGVHSERSADIHTWPRGEQTLVGSCSEPRELRRVLLWWPRWGRWGVGGRPRGQGMHDALRLTHVLVQHKPTQHCKSTILQLKIKNRIAYSKDYPSHCDGHLYLAEITQGGRRAIKSFCTCFSFKVHMKLSECFMNVHRSITLIAKEWAHHKCLSSDEWINKMWNIYIMKPIIWQ